MKAFRLAFSISAIVTSICLSSNSAWSENSSEQAISDPAAVLDDAKSAAPAEPKQGRITKSNTLTRLARPASPITGSPLKMNAKLDSQNAPNQYDKLAGSAKDDLLRAKVMEAAGMQPLSTKTSSSRYLLSASELSALSQYDICVMIDASGSMSAPDCISMKSFIIEERVSRWDWCGEQSELLSQQISPAFPHGITVIPFASRAKRFANVFPSRINDIFSEFHPGGATRLDAALDLELENFYSDKRFGIKRKPLLIAIISDGGPTVPGRVARQIFDLSNSVRPEEIKIVFFLIGTAPSGMYFVNQLSHLKETAGATNNIVSSRSFQSLCQFGLPRSLALTVQSLDKK